MGLLAAALPAIIHLIGRRRAPVINFSAMEFLLAVNLRLARRERLRRFLLLALRTLAIIALVAAVARPIRERPAAAATASKRRAIIVDTSSSMAYRLGAARLFDNAKKLALAAIAELEPGDTVALFAAGPKVRALLPAPTNDLTVARAAIAELNLDGGVADMGAALLAATEAFGDTKTPVIIEVVSDLAQNSFRALAPMAQDPLPEVRLLDAAKRRRPAALGNVSIEGVRVEVDKTSHLTRRFVVTLCNHGEKPITGRTLELVIDGEERVRGHLELAPRATKEKVFTYAFARPGRFDAEARLAPADDDGYEDDDRYFFGVMVAPEVRVLAINGDVGAAPYDDELFFFERALGAVRPGDPRFELVVVSAFDLLASDYDFSRFDVVVLANVATLPAARTARIVELVERGGGLLVTLGAKVKFEQANTTFGALLAHPLRDLYRARDEDAGTPSVRITEVDWDHPIMRELGSATEESLRASRTTSYFNLDVGAERQGRAILRFDNGAPALLEARQRGPGRVMLLTTSLDRDMSDLALCSAFPALMQRTVRYLARALDTHDPRELRQHGELTLVLPTTADGVRFTSPSGEPHVSRGAGRVVIAGLGEVGFYRAELEEAGALRRARDFDLAVSFDTRESDFLPVSTAEIAAALGEGQGGEEIAVSLGSTAGEDAAAARGYGSMLLLLVCLCFVGEGVLAARG